LPTGHTKRKRRHQYSKSEAQQYCQHHQFPNRETGVCQWCLRLVQHLDHRRLVDQHHFADFNVFHHFRIDFEYNGLVPCTDFIAGQAGFEGIIGIQYLLGIRGNGFVSKKPQAAVYEGLYCFIMNFGLNTYSRLGTTNSAPSILKIRMAASNAPISA